MMDIMIAGHLCLDIIPLFPDTGASRLEEIMRPGKLVNVQDAKINTGGPVSNTGINLKTMGNEVCFCARTGDDTIGKLTSDLLEQAGNADGVRQVNDTASSYTVVVAPPNIDRIFLHNPGTNDTFGPEDLDPQLIAQSRHFHFGYPPLMRRMYEDNGETLCQIFKIAKEAGATTSCDMALPDPASPAGKANWHAILEKVLPYVDVFLPSVEELLYMLDPKRFLDMKRLHNDQELIDFLTPSDYSGIAEETLSMGPALVSLKSGHRGFYIRSDNAEKFETMGRVRVAAPDNWANRELWMQAYTVERFGSATGSGDSSIAGFLSGLLKGLSIEESLQHAVCAGYQNVCVLDAVSGISNWKDAQELIDSNPELIDAHLEDNAWSQTATHGLWAGPNDSAAN